LGVKREEDFAKKSILGPQSYCQETEKTVQKGTPRVEETLIGYPRERGKVPRRA